MLSEESVRALRHFVECPRDGVTLVPSASRAFPRTGKYDADNSNHIEANELGRVFQEMNEPKSTQEIKELGQPVGGIRDTLSKQCFDQFFDELGHNG